MYLTDSDTIKICYIGRYVTIFEQHLQPIKPPSVVSHRPHSLSEHMKCFEASELGSFLLYYSLPVLLGILSAQYWNHFSLLSVTMYLLLQT